MTVIVTDTGFAPDTWSSAFTPWNGTGPARDLESDADPVQLNADNFEDVALIRIDFPSFADGRGFTLARLLRLNGYQGRLRARGHVIADQYAMARRAGFDEVEIDATLAKRQPESDWTDRAAWRSHDYQAHLRG
jgi:uncharacterized protein (DUF934 family)